MTSTAGIRFWQPVPEADADFVCASLEPRAGPSHIHEEWQFGVVENPSKLSVGAYTRYDASVNDITIVPPYAVHGEGSTVGPAPKWHILYVGSSTVSRLYRGQAPHFVRPVVTDPAAAARLRELLSQSNGGNMAGAEFLRQVDHWLGEFLVQHAEAAVASRRTSTVERARAYLQSRPTESITSREVSAIAGVTLSHLVRSFSRRVGLPPSSYHAQVRLARARRLLAEGKSATWVAYECGFADQSHLSRRFKECHGVTPGAFQAQYRAQRSPLEIVEPTAA